MQYFLNFLNSLLYYNCNQNMKNMTTSEKSTFETLLESKAYKKYKATEYDSFKYYYCKTIKDVNGLHLYLISFRLWDWTPYGDRVTEPYSYDVEMLLPADVSKYATSFTISFRNEMGIGQIEELAKNWFDLCVKNNLTTYNN